jgi:hypothetical protein
VKNLFYSSQLVGSAIIDVMPGKSKRQQAIEAEIKLSDALPGPHFAPGLVKRVEQFAFLGATNEEIAGFLNVDIVTFDRWRVEKPSLDRALHVGRELGDVRVAGALHRRAVGFTAKDQKVMNVGGKAQVIQYKRYFPPDVNAARFWLTNKRPKDWKERNGPDAGQTLDLRALVEALHRNRGDVAKRIDGEAKTVDDTQ